MDRETHRCQTKKKKNFCIKNNKTNRCVLSMKKDETSDNCVFNRQRCIVSKQIPFEMYGEYKIAKPVKTFITNKILKRSAAQMRASDPEGDDWLSMYPDDQEMKEVVINEVLDLAKNHARDSIKSDVITMKSVKHVISSDDILKEILH